MDDGFGEVDQPGAGLLGLGAEQVEGFLLVDRMGRHEDPLRLLDHGAARESTLEVVVLGEPAQDDVERRLELGDVVVGDVGEDPTLGGFVDELGVAVVEQRDDGAGGLETPPDLAERFGVQTVPTLCVVEERRLRKRITAPRGCRELERELAPWLN